jgi:hypothetical protein
MDPLSITASVLTVAGTIVKALEKIQILHHAPDEFQALVNEVSDIQVILGEIETVLQERSVHAVPGHVPDTALSRLLERAKDTLLVLQTLIDDRLVGSPSGTGGRKVAKFTWLRERSRVKDIQENLHILRQNLAVALANLNL